MQSPTQFTICAKQGGKLMLEVNDVPTDEWALFDELESERE